MKKIKEILERLKEIAKDITGDKKKLVITVVILFVLVIIFRGCAGSVSEKKQREQALKDAQEQQATEDTSANAVDTSADSILLQQQPDLAKAYGSVPEGYIWDTDGTLLSLGDSSMSAEDVVYAYLNGIRTLDFSMAQKYSRNSVVVSNYGEYFDASSANSDYFDSFMRNMYKQALLSIEVQDITDNSVFAENKQVFTVKLKMLDLTSKDFWEKDKEAIYDTLYVYSSDESDSTKGEMYLYDYVLNYYQSDVAKTRTVSVNLTVEKYPDINTGWLVSVDSDINKACNYTDGTLMVNYINKMYASEGIQYIQDKRKSDSESVESTEE